MFDIIIQNALIYDGTGEPAYLGNVAIKDGKIAAVSKEPISGAAKIVDAKGLHGRGDGETDGLLRTLRICYYQIGGHRIQSSIRTFH